MGIVGVLLAMAVYMVILYFVIDFFRSNVKASMWFWGAATLSFPLWFLIGNLDGWFRWAKILSVLIPLTIVGMSRVAVAYNKKGKLWEFLASKKWLWFPFAILFLNIAEATIKDIQFGNYANSLTGLILCITIPFAPKFWEYTKDGKAELIAYTTAGWNLLYTSWNLNFVYGETGAFFAASLSILLVAELYPIIKGRPELYIMARIYTLGFHLLLRAFWDFSTVMSAQGWFNETVWTNWAYLNAACAVVFVFWFTWQLHTGRAAMSFRRGKAREAFLAENPEIALQFASRKAAIDPMAGIPAAERLTDLPADSLEQESSSAPPKQMQGA